MAAPQSKEEQIPRIYTRLQRAIDDEDDEKVLELAQNILDLSSEEEEAALCKLVSYIHLSKFNEALNFIRQRGKKESSYVFEEAYCLYRLERYEESLKVLSGISMADTRSRELQAQIAYKCEEYHKAHATYQQLLEQGSATPELSTNYYATACLSSETCALTALEGHVTSGDTMEQCFNLACVHLVCGQVHQAQQMLDKAEKTLRCILEEEEYSEEEIAEEMIVLEVLRGYLLQVQGRPKEALLCYNSVLKLRPEDPGLLAVVANNVLVVNGDRDVFDSKKRVKVLVSEGSSKKLTCVQRSTMLFNRCLFALQTNQLDQCRELIGQLHRLQPDNYPLAVLAESALLFRERKLSGALELLQTFTAHSKPGRLAVDLYTSLAQLHLLQGDTGKACSTLKKLPDSSSRVGVASSLAQLYYGLGCTDEAMKVLQEMLQSWLQRHGNNDDLRTMTSDLVSNVAKFQLVHNEFQLAAETLEAWRRGHQLDLRALALLISTYARISPRKAEELRRELPVFTTSRELDVEKLEQAPMIRHKSGLTKTAAQGTEAVTEVVKEKKKTKRKPRLPKNYDANVPSDPERWLPLKERSYYRRSRRKGMAATVRGSQGIGAVSAALMNQLDASKPSKTETMDGGVGEGGAAGDSTSSPKTTHKSSSQQAKKKSKKKKGNKW